VNRASWADGAAAIDANWRETRMMSRVSKESGGSGGA
jgi:hypothetical protein